MTGRKGCGWKVANMATVASAVVVLALQVLGLNGAAVGMMAAYSAIWFLRMGMDCLANDGDVDGMGFGDEMAAAWSVIRAMPYGYRMLLACSCAAWVGAFSMISAVFMAGWGFAGPVVVYAVSAVILIMSGAAFLTVTKENHRMSMEDGRVPDVGLALSVIGERTADEGKTV